MAVKTWRVKFAGRELQVKLLKADAEHLSERLHRLDSIRQYTRELSGIKGGDEYAMLVRSFCIGGGGSVEPLPAEEQYTADLAAFVASIPELIDKSTAPEILSQANALFSQYVRQVDKRQTTEEKAARDQEWRQHTEQQQERMRTEAAVFCQKYGASAEPVTIPAGMMAVYLCVNFDDSDIRSDYFNSHHSLGEKMLLAIVTPQAETERLARQTVAKYPELQALSWTWDSQKWSMGHGNWLQSGKIGTEKRSAYDGRSEVDIWYEVQFSKYDKQMHSFRGYPGTTPAAPVMPKPENGKAVTVRHNEEHNGIEVIFAERPAKSVTEQLKRWGFRWSRYQGLWYRHYSPRLFDEVRAALCPAEIPAEAPANNPALTLQGPAPESLGAPEPSPTPERPPTSPDATAQPEVLEHCGNCHYTECNNRTRPEDNGGAHNWCKAWAPLAGSAADAAITKALAMIPTMTA